MVNSQSAYVTNRNKHWDNDNANMWQSAFLRADGVRFTRTPDSEIKKRKLAKHDLKDQPDPVLGAKVAYPASESNLSNSEQAKVLDSSLLPSEVIADLSLFGVAKAEFTDIIYLSESALFEWLA